MFQRNYGPIDVKNAGVSYKGHITVFKYLEDLADRR